MEYYAGEFDVLIIGAGHAGVEAALAAARLGCRTGLFCLSLDAVANLPCNPSIGGTGKGQLVREIDALGGQMGLAADYVCLQSRMLNMGKGPAVQSLRMQSDRRMYTDYMREILQKQENLLLIQAEVVSIEVKNGAVDSVLTALGARYGAKTVIIAAGTYLSGKIFVGEVSYAGGPDSSVAAAALSRSLAEIGVELRRFKTGTPARVDAKSIDFSRLERQDGDSPPLPFSYLNLGGGWELCEQMPCHIAWTNERTHEVIRRNLHRSPLYGGAIEGIGPRYCPSIEDKVVRFPDRERHQVFVEPVTRRQGEMYLQGMSSSLPGDVQLEFMRTVDGFENIRIMRTGYAIEYDCCDPTSLFPTLEFKNIANLYGAGQFNGTSGYEEAAAQGLVAGINAARKVQGRSEFTMARSESYIGTLIDDIVTKGVLDPYRMMTSRCEYRLLLRQDNADLRLTEKGRELGLVDDVRWGRFLARREEIGRARALLDSTVIRPAEPLERLLEAAGYPPCVQPISAAELLKRPHIDIYDIYGIIEGAEPPAADVAEHLQTDIKYEGYIKIQLEQAEKLARLEKRRLPADADYGGVEGLRLEAREKLNRIKPQNLGQAMRISGVTPADVSVLSVWLAQAERSGRDEV